MARTIEQIKQQIIDEKNAQPELSSLNSPSQTAVYNLWMYLTAVAIFLLESLQDIFRTEIDDIAFRAKPGTRQWVRKKTMEFQYSATTPQVAELTPEFIVTYPVVNTALQIITRCSVTTSNNRIVRIKVAKSTPPEPLITAELNALDEYVELWNNAGVAYNIISLNPDRIRVEAEVYYDAQYTQTIMQGNVIDAINNFIRNLPFDGSLSVQKLVDSIQAVAGVMDVKIIQLKVRAEAVPFASASLLYDLATGTNGVKYDTVAGYIIAEDTAGETLTDTLTFIAQ